MSKQKKPLPLMERLSTGIPILKTLHDEWFKLAEAETQTKMRKPGGRYKSKDVIGLEYWADHPEWHWHIGCCIADWERTRKLPIRFLGCPHCSVRYYERI